MACEFHSEVRIHRFSDYCCATKPVDHILGFHQTDSENAEENIQNSYDMQSVLSHLNKIFMFVDLNVIHPTL